MTSSAVAFDGFVADGGHRQHDAAARADFLDVGDHLVVGVALDGDADHGKFVGDEGDGAVLHFAGGVAFGVDVADFLELERALKRDSGS